MSTQAAIRSLVRWVLPRGIEPLLSFVASLSRRTHRAASRWARPMQSDLAQRLHDPGSEIQTRVLCSIASLPGIEPHPPFAVDRGTFQEALLQPERLLSKHTDPYPLRG